MVLLPKGEYEALISAAAEAEEDAADIAIYDARKAEAGPLLPAEVSMAILRGESRLRALRQWRDLTQVHLAREIEVSQGFLSDLENGRRNMTAGARGRIARVLSVPEAWLE
jgi:DNA-binding XRE family transcriptional regulator